MCRSCLVRASMFAQGVVRRGGGAKTIRVLLILGAGEVTLGNSPRPITTFLACLGTPATLLCVLAFFWRREGSSLLRRAAVPAPPPPTPPPSCVAELCGSSCMTFATASRLAWAKASGCRWDAWTRAVVSQGRHPEALRWARDDEFRCPWSEMACRYAA